MAEYRIQTDVYNGPLDLLLYLIKRDEVDIYDIPVSRVTEQYCRYVELLKVIDPNVAGDFLVMATVLMEIKSRMLLPRQVDEDGEPDDLTDPRLELVHQLLEYKKFKDASFEMERAAELQAQRWPRSPARIKQGQPGEVDLDDVQIWDLVAAFNKIMVAIGAGQTTHDVVFDDTPISLHAADILDRLQSDGGALTFEEIFVGRTRAEMIGLFLALLELMRQGRVRVTQQDGQGPVRISLLSSEPIEIGEEWAPALRQAVLDSNATQDDAAAKDADTEASSSDRQEKTTS